MSKRCADPGGWASVTLLSLVLVCPLTAQAQIKLQYKYPEGQKLTYKLTENVSQVVKMAGQSFSTEQERTSSTSWTFGKKRENSTQPIAHTIEEFSVDISLPGGIDISYDTKDPSAKIAHAELSYLVDVFNLLSHLDYTVVLDAQNKVQAVEGTEKLLQKTDKLDSKAKQLLTDTVNPQHLKEDFEEEHGNLPDGLVRPQESWERTETLRLGNGQILTLRRRYECAGTEKRGDATLERINVKTSEVKYEMDPHSPSPLKVLNSDLKVMSGDGYMLFDREAGRVVVSKGKTHIKGPMTFQSGGQEIPGELDFTYDADLELQPGSK